MTETAHGGKRNGAGRKAGAATVKTREIADRAAAEGITPLEVMLANMRWAWNELDGLVAAVKDKVANGDSVEAALALRTLMTGRQLAQQCAVDAASFMHPRMAAVDHTSNGESMTAVYSGVPRAHDPDKTKTSHH